MDRRDFVIATTTAALAATHVSRLPFPASRIPRVGLQLYTVRNLMQKDVAGTLAAVAKIGYQEVEFAGFFDKTPADIRVMLETNGLVAPSGHVPFEAIDTGWDQVLDAAHTLGQRYVCVAWIDAK